MSLTLTFDSSPHPQRHSHELCYEPLRGAARRLRFPCDDGGHVDLDALSDADRRDYLYARVVTGRELAWPVVRAATGSGHPSS